LSRYENGALQDETHEKALRLAMEPRNLLTLINKTPDAIGDPKRERLVKEIGMIEDVRNTFESRNTRFRSPALGMHIFHTVPCPTTLSSSSGR
jgi:hypothetical protein